MIIRTRRQRREMRAELQNPPPAIRTSTKTKSEFLDKTYKFFLRKRDDVSEEETRRRFVPPEYRIDGLPVQEIIRANSLRRDEWPESLPESLNWLTDLCVLAGTYPGAWALSNTEALNDIASAFVHRPGNIWHSSEGILLVLLISLCARVKETQHKLYPHLSTYVDVFAAVIQQPVSGQHFIQKLNSRYEFHEPALEILVPSIYAIFTQPYIKQIANVSKEPSLGEGALSLKIDLFESFEVKAYQNYRSHVEVMARHGLQTWKQMEKSHDKMDLLLEQRLQFPPTVLNLIWSTLSELFTEATPAQTAHLNQKSALVIKNALLKTLIGPSPTAPKSFLLCRQLVKTRILNPAALAGMAPALWVLFNYILSAELEPQADLSDCSRQRGVFGTMLLVLIEPVEPPEHIIYKLRLFCNRPESYVEDSTVYMRIWQVISMIPCLIDDVPNITSRARNAPEFVRRAIRILINTSKCRHNSRDSGSDSGMEYDPETDDNGLEGEDDFRNAITP